MQTFLTIILKGDSMFQCNVCGSSEYYEDNVKKAFNINGEIIIVDNIPAKICKKCSEESFSRDTLVHIQSIIYGQPKQYIKAKSFDYA
jgi:HTH-type transcriptional regulator / antitoxin MqsA